MTMATTLVIDDVARIEKNTLQQHRILASRVRVMSGGCDEMEYEIEMNCKIYCN